MTAAEQYAEEQVRWIRAYWPGDDGFLEMTPDVLAGYLAIAWLDGGIAAQAARKESE
jgi:hypothetical protein